MFLGCKCRGCSWGAGVGDSSVPSVQAWRRAGAQMWERMGAVMGVQVWGWVPPRQVQMAPRGSRGCGAALWPC